MTFAHLDDVLVLLLAAVAVDRALRHDARGLGLATGLAVATKPWALGLVVLLLALPEARRRLAGTGWFAVGAAPWLPFLLVPGTFGALGGFRVLVRPDSPLTLLGLTYPEPMPGWVRPAQLLLALLLGWLAIHRGRPAAVPLAVVVARVVLDPGAFSYYYTGLVLACVLREVIGTERLIPWLTALLVVLDVEVKWLVDSDPVLASINLSCLLLVPFVLVGRRRHPPPELAPAQAGSWGGLSMTSPGRGRVDHRTDDDRDPDPRLDQAPGAHEAS